MSGKEPFAGMEERDHTLSFRLRISLQIFCLYWSHLSMEVAGLGSDSFSAIFYSFDLALCFSFFIASSILA
jgi:hypothetical protein